jgi:hypothetical protein
MAIIVDPYNYSKEIYGNITIDFLKEFSKVNNLEMPKVSISKAKNNINGCYAFSNKEITVYYKNCRTPVKTPGYAWSYTGYKSDLTISGILAHEYGHYIDHIRGEGNNTFSDINYKKIINLILTENEIIDSHKYMQPYHHLHETIAESAKLFILNPDLLRIGRPKRYELFVNDYGLKPIVTESWTEVLKNAHPKIINSSETWIKRGTKKRPNKYDIMKGFLKV